MPHDPTPQVRAAADRPDPKTEPGSAPAAEPAAQTTAPKHTDAQGHGLKETLTSITIAFVLAFVFRGFVVEAFQIPTGSMAPTLLGAHMRFDSDMTGNEWTVGPWYYGPNQTPYSVQAPAQVVNANIESPGAYEDDRGLPITAIIVADPMSGQPLGGVNPTNGFPNGLTDVPIDAGDRIFVMKQLYRLLPPALGGPRRWDCIVFRDPTDPHTNFIKRLIGLPGEQIALVEGDVFVRDAGDGEPAPWTDRSWKIARKPERVQRAVWQPLYSSAYAPIEETFNPLWIGRDGWETAGRTYTFDGSVNRTTLDWDNDRRAIDDLYPYNQTPGSTQNPERPSPAIFNVPDIAMSMGFEPQAENSGDIIAYIRIQGRDIRTTIGEKTVLVDTRGLRTVDDPNPTWSRLTSGAHSVDFPPGEITTIEFWHADQAISLFANGERFFYWEYDQTPAERIAQASGRAFDVFLSAEAANPDPNFFDNPGLYRRSDAAWIFENVGAFELHDVALSRDIYYQPGTYGSPFAPTSHSRDRQPFAGTHPLRNEVVLGPDHFFGCGDNSPASSDSRAWDKPHPWVAATVDPTIGVVHRDLLIGKAFFVYFPAPHRVAGKSIIPDFGRLRWVW